MQENITIGISHDLDLAIRQNSETKEALFVRELRNKEAFILKMLVSYHYESRGQVSDLVFDDSIRFKDQLTGTFIVKYKLNYFIGCSDINYDEQGVMTIEFKFNPENDTLELAGENIPEREPDQF